MANAPGRAICWTPLWNKAQEGVGLEYLLLAERAADSVVLAIDDERGPFRLAYRLAWGPLHPGARPHPVQAEIGAGVLTALHREPA